MMLYLFFMCCFCFLVFVMECALFLVLGSRVDGLLFSFVFLLIIGDHWLVLLFVPYSCSLFSFDFLEQKQDQGKQKQENLEH